MNILKGGTNNTKMTPTQVQTWGSTLLANSLLQQLAFAHMRSKLLSLHVGLLRDRVAMAM
jgi:hypothetical protein